MSFDEAVIESCSCRTLLSAPFTRRRILFLRNVVPIIVCIRIHVHSIFSLELLSFRILLVLLLLINDVFSGPKTSCQNQKPRPNHEHENKTTVDPVESNDDVGDGPFPVEFRKNGSLAVASAHVVRVISAFSSANTFVGTSSSKSCYSNACGTILMLATYFGQKWRVKRKCIRECS